MQEVRDRLARGEAAVWTAMEMKERVRKGDIPTVDEVDIVTTGTFGVMSGTAAVMTVPRRSPPVRFSGRTRSHSMVSPAFPRSLPE